MRKKITTTIPVFKKIVPRRFEIEKENHNNNFSEDNEEVDGKEKYLK